MVIISGSSYRHMLGMASFVRKVYKLKRHKSDHIPRIEGKDCKNWMCLDLGNIALHIFNKQSREHYSLETLWTLGEEYENRTKSFDKVEDIYEEFLNTANVSDSQKV
jgi:ribosome silencing factor RsfS/YbeB/iojap